MLHNTDIIIRETVRFDASSKIIDADFGTKTVLESDWDISNNPSPDAPATGFLFTNKKVAACVIYKEIKGEFKPIYISHVGRMPVNSKETLIPINKVGVWFSSDFESGTMIDGFQGEFKLVDMTTRKTAKVSYDAEGRWISG